MQRAYNAFGLFADLPQFLCTGTNVSYSLNKTDQKENACLWIMDKWNNVTQAVPHNEQIAPVQQL